MNDFKPSYIGLRKDLVDLVTGQELTILDIGCATGTTGKFLKDKGITSAVYGVELDEDMSYVARENIDIVLTGDIQQDLLMNQIPSYFFDYIILGDVLEHLHDPWGILKKLDTKLKPGGTVIISVPNISHIDVFIHLFIKQEWPLNERGIFDKTHIRFFSKKNILNIFDNTNITFVKFIRKFRFRDKLNSKFPFYGKILKTLLPNIYTFQYIIIGKKKD